MNLIGPQVRKWRTMRGWSQQALAAKLQLKGWGITRDSLASLELQRRRVPDCELLFMARVLGIELVDLFPKSIALGKVGPQFQTGQRLSVHPTRTEQ
jgi:transcriptional regulator with XRE-family HTH domain